MKLFAMLFAYLVILSASTTSAVAYEPFGVVIINNVVLRSSPKKSATVIQLLPKMTYVLIKAEKDGYLKIVRPNEFVGWTPDWAVRQLSRQEVEALVKKREQSKPRSTGKSAYSGQAVRKSQPPVLRPMPKQLLPKRNATKVYIGTGGGHWVKDVSDGGNIVTLEDGSLWKISPIDTIDTSLWLPTSDIVVLDGEDPSYPYRLINKDDGETAEAKFIGFE